MRSAIVACRRTIWCHGMIKAKALPAEVHGIVFNCSRNWRLHPYLYPVPKQKGIVTLDNLRPLGLYKIFPTTSAHAHRRGVGTVTAILQLLNLIEDGIETMGHKRDFDSIPHSLVLVTPLHAGFIYVAEQCGHCAVAARVKCGPHNFPSEPLSFAVAHEAVTAPSFHQER